MKTFDEYEYSVGYTVIKTGRSDHWDRDWTDREEAQERVDRYEHEWFGMEAGFSKIYDARLVKRRKAGEVLDA